MSTALPAARIFMVGNSVTDSVNFDQFQQLAQSRGYTHIWGRQIILGSPLWNIWNNPDSGFTTVPFYGYANALPNYDWDAVTLQTYDSGIDQDLESFGRFLNLARTRPYNASNTEFFVFARWPRQGADRAGSTADSFDAYWTKISNGSENLSETGDHFEKFTNRLRTNHPGVSIRMIPVGHVFYELNQRMRAGQVPGFTKAFDLYSDGVHQTDAGRYITAITFFATIYKDDPRGLPLVGFNITAEQAAIFQEVVWEVVTRTPLSGVSSGEGLTITTTRLPRGSVNRAYSTNLRALFGTEPYTWAVKTGSLPPGLSLTGAGVLSGTPTQAGDFPLTLEVTDGADLTATADTTITITLNTIPSILTTSLPSGNQGTPYNVTLQSELGDPPLKWSLSEGKLPLGVTLSSDGRLVGTPAVSGNFNITLKLEDDDFPADTDTQAVTLSVGAPEANTVTVSRVMSPVVLDGVANEAFWTLGRTLAQPVLGSPVQTAKFGAVWDTEGVYVAVEVLDATLPGAGESDEVELLIDGRHDRETVYNVDDRRIIVGRDGSVREFFNRGSGVRAAVQSTDAGYVVEILVPWDNLNRAVYAGLGLGVDVLVRQNLSASSQVLSWEGADATNPSPAGFGNFLLSGTVAGPVGADVLIAYEPFNGPAGGLTGSGVPLGWSQPWTVQNQSARLPGYEIAEPSPLKYGNHRTYGELKGQGLRATGGREYLSSGRMLDVNGVFASYASGGKIGKAGSTLWFSWLVRQDSGGAEVTSGLADGGIDWNPADNERRLIVSATSGGRWTLNVTGANALDLGPVVSGQAALVVFRVDYGATNSVTAYFNPTTLGGAAPASASASTTTTSNLGTTRFLFNPGSSAGAGSIDEIRIGTSYAAVTPLTDYAPLIDVQPAGGKVRLDASKTLAVSAFSRTAMTYTWFRDGQKIDAATGPELLLGPITEADLGTYTVRLANAVGTTTSAEAVLTLDPYPTDGYRTWVLTWSTEAAAESLPTADPDLDGLTNLAEYAFGTTPKVANDAKTLLCTVSATAEGRVQVATPALRNDASAYCHLTHSTDLELWSALPEATGIVQTAAPGKPGFSIHTATLPADYPGQGFFRVEVRE